MDIIGKLREMGYTTVDASFYDKAAEWRSWYRGNVARFHEYRVRNGHNTVKCKRYSMGMGKKLAEDWANLLLNEKVQITIDGAKEQAFVDEVLKESNFAVKGNEMQEMAFALGTAAFIPRVVGMETGPDGVAPGSASGIIVDYVTVEHIYPLTWQNGSISECAFTSTVNADGHKFLYMQIHRKTETGLYDIENRVFRFDNDTVGAELALTEVKGYERIPFVVHTGSNKRQFVIDRPNIANNIDHSVPLGISVFANAIDVLQGVDIAYDSYVNEFVLGKKRIMVKPAAMNYLDGEPIFDSDDLVFYVLPEDLSDGAVITPIDMDLRTAEHNTGIQDQLNILSSKCGFGQSHYKFDQGTIATATQVISQNSELARTLGKHQLILRSCLQELCHIILRLGNAAMNAGLNEDVEVTIRFDDSIFIDTESERAQDRQDVSMGAMNLWEYRMKWYGETEAEAKANLPGMEELTDEPEDEIE